MTHYREWLHSELLDYNYCFNKSRYTASSLTSKKLIYILDEKSKSAKQFKMSQKCSGIEYKVQVLQKLFLSCSLKMCYIPSADQYVIWLHR